MRVDGLFRSVNVDSKISAEDICFSLKSLHLKCDTNLSFVSIQAVKIGCP